MRSVDRTVGLYTCCEIDRCTVQNLSRLPATPVPITLFERTYGTTVAITATVPCRDRIDSYFWRFSARLNCWVQCAAAGETDDSVIARTQLTGRMRRRRRRRRD